MVGVWVGMRGCKEVYRGVNVSSSMNNSVSSLYLLLSIVLGVLYVLFYLIFMRVYRVFFILCLFCWRENWGLESLYLGL